LTDGKGPIKVVILGAGAQGNMALATIKEMPAIEVLGFLDDRTEMLGESVAGKRVVGTRGWFSSDRIEDTRAFVAVGNNETRRSLSTSFRAKGIHLINVIHPSSVVMRGAKLGSGILVLPHAVVATGACISDDAVVNTAATLDHDSHVGPGAYLSPGVHTGGSVLVGENTFVGAGAILGPGVKVGSGSVIGAGSVVLRDIPKNVLAYGTPARVIQDLKRPLDWRRILAGEYADPL